MKCHVVLTTIFDKIDWLKRTIYGLSVQKDVELDIHVCVDRKPWDRVDKDIEAELASINTSVMFHVEPTSSDIKRQHEMINRMISSLPPDEPVLIMDDDYWLLNDNSIANMLSTFAPGIVVGCKGFIDTFYDDLPIMGDCSVYDGRIRYFERDISSLSHVDINDNPYGMHPMCGVPKIFLAGEFTSLGGFDHKRFRHYWFSDTDLLIRVKKNLDFRLVDVPCIHARHDRNKPDMFGKINASRFLKSYENDPEVNASYIHIAKETLNQ